LGKLQKPGKEARSISLRVRITPRLLKQLKQLAEDDRRTVSNFVAALLEKYVESNDDRPPLKPLRKGD
jgi:mRNA-degrading endonuclease RelE of RelBE toxin-antitoxin system